MSINKEKLKEIDLKIDSEIGKFPLLRQPRDVALLHLITHYERFISFEATAATRNIVAHHTLSKNAQDGIDFAIQWIYKYSSNSKKDNVVLQPKLLKQAKELLDQAIEYSSVWDFMNLLWRDMCKAKIESENKIIVNYKDDYKRESDIINRFLNDPDDADTTIKEVLSFINADPIRLTQEIGYQIDNRRNLIYTIPNSTYIELYKLNLEAKKHLWELDERWDLGGYTVKDFRHFFNYLRTISTAHLMGCMFMHRRGKKINNHCLIKTKTEWVSDIIGNITINKEKCIQILEDLTYNTDLYKEDNKTPDVTYQPFIYLTNGKLLLFNTIVQQSNFERNHWDLLSIIRPDLHSRLKNEKENLWRDNLKKFCKSLGLIVKGPFNITNKNKSSDVDFILIDPKLKFLIVIELKWITSPDRIKDVTYLSKEMAKGLNQIEFALEYIDSKKEEFSNKIEIDISEYTIRGMVLSKNSMGNGFTFNENIPIINERIFKWILADPHHKNIEILWKASKEERFFPRIETHYQDADDLANFAGLEFIGNGTGLIMKRQFDPRTDINFEGIS